MEFYLRRKSGWTRWWARCAVLGAHLAVLGALGRVGHGFGSATLGWVGRGIWPCWAHWARLGVGFGSGGRAGLGWARIWLSVYGLHSTCLLHVFMMSLIVFMCISDVYHGA